MIFISPMVSNVGHLFEMRMGYINFTPGSCLAVRQNVKRQHIQGAHSGSIFHSKRGNVDMCMSKYDSLHSGKQLMSGQGGQKIATKAE